MKDGQTIGQWLKWNFKTNGELVVNDKNGRPIYLENSNGYWSKREWDSNGKEIYWEDSDGCWLKYEWDSKGNQIYFEDSKGKIIDNRPKTCENKIVEIEGIKYKLVKQ